MKEKTHEHDELREYFDLLKRTERTIAHFLVLIPSYLSSGRKFPGKSKKQLKKIIESSKKIIEVADELEV